MMCGLFHNAVRATDLDATRGFYTRFLGMQVDGRRPPMNVPGFWLRAALPDSVPSIHIFGEHFAEVDGRIPMGSAAVHHLALYCTGYRETREQIDRYGLNWRGLTGPTQWQLFVHDPNGVLLELTFDAATEGIPPPEVPEACRYAGRFDWFDVSQYDAFRR